MNNDTNITDVEIMDNNPATDIVAEENTNNEWTSYSNDAEPITIMSSYNPSTGDVFVTGLDLETVVSDNNKAFEELEDDDINPDVLKNMISDSDLSDIEDISKLTNVLKKKKSGQKVTYDELPRFMQSEVNKLCLDLAKQAGNIPKNYQMSRANVIDTVLTEMLKEYDDNSLNFDLDTMLNGLNTEIEEAMTEMSTELGGMMMSFDEERKANLDEAIAKCKEEGKEDSVLKLEQIKSTFSDAYNLDKFAEACSHIKIKKYEIEKPQKIYRSFNFKYEKHKNVINDISYCPEVLNRHLPEYTLEQKTALCIAFCKYCQNMSPDNMDEHTFMYYFIRNIIALDRLNPKGKLYETMDDKSKKFYDEFSENLKKCLSNLLQRNITLK